MSGLQIDTSLMQVSAEFQTKGKRRPKSGKSSRAFFRDQSNISRQTSMICGRVTQILNLIVRKKYVKYDVKLTRLHSTWPVKIRLHLVWLAIHWATFPLA